ncbi:immunoglobulin superfamily member 3-like [Latimeria chalumnae]|uniref:Immunoglobulin superfamily member 3 n=1 Tax=Latimeria chalumnae TaxID=7897 RepID=H3B0S4_LATCH|nr:PREDICTED: immunoglobulin superfamily member 3-like [Latimeria chalumnae]XP_014342497.1 PREDICTED: immunoglobulin superfamily member 3-like [Latimeria chalumnae]|eukprot:XP_005993666.1 PREDICTED: immunoglobulin superfamily member 3-like [Latimeria chalumnae]
MKIQLVRGVKMVCLLWYLSLPLLGVISAQRMVTVQSGRLYRTEGSHITIWCNVTGYKGSSEQNFEWSVYLTESPDREVKIISTSNPHYAYAVYDARVRNKEIYIERVSGDSVLLHITNLQPRDQGEYECYTPNTDPTYLGTYSAKMNLSVIPDTLSVMSVPQTLNDVEGESLELTCEVSKKTSQHTHLSVTWNLQKGDQTVQVISLSRDFVLRPGSSYAQRYASGNIRLDKTGRTAYKLTIYKLQPSDQGKFYCEAAEWIQDPDESWFSMTKKTAEKTAVNVQATDREFSVRVDTEKRFYMTGEALELKCVIEAQNAANRFFTISWSFNSTPIAVVRSNAILTVNGEYALREQTGQMKVGKESDTLYVLKFQWVRPEDSGKYNCRVTEQEKTVTGELLDKDSKRSKNTHINVQPFKSSIIVSMASDTTTVLEGDTLQFTCNVRKLSRTRNRLAVAWQQIDKQNRRNDIIQLDKGGVLQVGPSYRERGAHGDVRMERVRLDSFTLRIYNTLETDEGQYECRVIEWFQEPDGNWQKIGEHFDTTAVSVTPLESGFSVTAISRTPGVTYNDSFDLQCIIKPRYPSRVPVSVTWRFQPSDATEFHDLVTFSRDAAIQWGDWHPNFRTKSTVEKAAADSNVRLSISRASDMESGKYQCAAEVWRRKSDNSWVKLVNTSSNQLEIKVSRPASKLQVSKSKRSLTLLENDPILLNCSVLSQTSPESRFSVLWYAQKSADAAAKLLLKVNPASAFEYGTYAEEEGLKGRLQFERSSAGTYSLTVQKAHTSDSGSYYCHVEEWLLNPNSIWYKLAEEVSGLAEVTVKQPDNNLQVSKVDNNFTVVENDTINMECVISNRTRPDSQISVEWFVRKPDQTEEQPLIKLKRNSVLELKVSAGQDLLKERLQFERPSTQLYSLILQRAEVLDSGSYYCRVEEWLLDPAKVWYKRAEDTSGQVVVTVQRPEIALEIDGAESNLTVKEKGMFQLHCNVLASSSKQSHFAVTWYTLNTQHGSQEAEKEEVFSISHDSMFRYGSGSRQDRLQFKRPSPDVYSLMIQRAEPGDSGTYICQVQEWLQDPRNNWYTLTERESGLTVVTVQHTGSSLQSVICSNDSLFYFVFFYPFPIFGILIITILLVRYRGRGASKSSEGKNGVPLLWIKEPHLNYSPTCMEPPSLAIHPGSME